MTSGSTSTGRLVLSENEVIQSSAIDLRVDGIHNEKQYMEELKKTTRKDPG